MVESRLHGRKRDGSDIASLGNLLVISRDATRSANCSWRVGVSRFEPRRGADAVVRVAVELSGL